MSTLPLVSKYLKIFNFNGRGFDGIGNLDPSNPHSCIQLGYKDSYRSRPLGQFVLKTICQGGDRPSMPTWLAATEFWYKGFSESFYAELKTALTRLSASPFGGGFSEGVKRAEATTPHLAKMAVDHGTIIAHAANLALGSHQKTRVIHKYDDSHPLLKLLKNSSWRDRGRIIKSLVIILSSCVFDFFKRDLEEEVKSSLVKEVGETLARFAGLSTEDQRARFTLDLVGGKPLLGAGLINAFSDDIEVIGKELHPHTEARRFEVLSEKAILKNVVRHPSGRFVTVLTTHLQEGADDADVAIRAKQFEHLRRHIREARDAGMPVIVAGDLNIIGEEIIDKTTGLLGPTREYLDQIFSLQHDLGMVDTYRVKKCHPDPNDPKDSGAQGYTYDAVRTGYPSLTRDEAAQRLDYILASPEFDVVSSEVMRDDFKFGPDALPELRITHLSDHFPVVTVLKFRSKYVVYEETFGKGALKQELMEDSIVIRQIRAAA